ncbi:MAG TPA: GNAT family N-acetyltransferase [Steroidobacteraceae bacterium]|jgi:ribosomal protein S18 acetylase RimI-like enzyme
MTEVDRLQRAASVEFSLADPHGAEAQTCLEQYYGELASRFKEGFDRDAGGAAAVEDFNQPNGCFLIARLLGKAVGCGAIRTLGPGMGEIKRMWVSPEARGLGLGRKLLEELEQSARKLKLHTVRLDTNETLGEAIGLYLASGYRAISRFNDNPYAHHWFEKTLT